MSQTKLLDQLESNLITLSYAETEFYCRDELADGEMMFREMEATIALLIQHDRLTEQQAEIYLHSNET